MIGHRVSCTVWSVRVGWYADPPKAPEGTPPPPKGIWEMHETFVVTATDDGSDVFECARRKFFRDNEEAARREFSLVHVGRVGHAEGLALGHEGAPS